MSEPLKMSKKYRLNGLSDVEIDRDKQEMTFRLLLDENRAVVCTGGVAIVEHIISGLAQMTMEIRGGNPHRKVHAENPTAYGVQRDRLHDVVLLRFVTEAGVPITFALRTEHAIDIADRLKRYSAPSRPPGRA